MTTRKREFQAISQLFSDPDWERSVETRLAIRDEGLRVHDRSTSLETSSCRLYGDATVTVDKIPAIEQRTFDLDGALKLFWSRDMHVQREDDDRVLGAEFDVSEHSDDRLY